VPCRPRTYARIIADLYPKGSTGFELSLVPNKLSRLCGYAKDYPQKLPLLCVALEKNISAEIKSKKLGFLKVSIESFRSLVEVAMRENSMSVVEPFMRSILMKCLDKEDSMILTLGSSIFFTYTYGNSQCNIQDFIQPILRICTRNMLSQSNNAAEQSVGLELLLRSIEVLLPFGVEIERYSNQIVPIVFHYFTAQRVYFTEAPPNEEKMPSRGHESGGNSWTGNIWHPRSPVVISTLCLVALGSAKSPVTLVAVILALFHKLDELSWEPLQSAIKALRLLASSSIIMNRFESTLCSLLISHCRSIVNNPINHRSTERADQHFARLTESMAINTLGSEAAIRVTASRISLLGKILFCATAMFPDRFKEARTYLLEEEHEVETRVALSASFGRTFIRSDVENILEILFFCAENSLGSVLGRSDLPSGCLCEGMSGFDVKVLPSESAAADDDGSLRKTGSRLVAAKCMQCLTQLVQMVFSRSSDGAGEESCAQVFQEAVAYFCNLPERARFMSQTSSMFHTVQVYILQAVLALLQAHREHFFGRLNTALSSGEPINATLQLNASTFQKNCLLRSALYLASPIHERSFTIFNSSSINSQQYSQIALLLLHDSSAVATLSASAIVKMLPDIDVRTVLTSYCEKHECFIDICRASHSTDDLSVRMNKAIRLLVYEGDRECTVTAHRSASLSSSRPTEAALLSSLYDCIFIALSEYTGPSHSDRVFSLWLLQVYH
jgi:hypothetical protein